MNHKIVLSALALALMFGGASGVMAAGKKHNGHEAYAAASAGNAATQVTDPRVNKGGNHENWCDVNPQCNGWNEWVQDVNSGKLQDK
ncbi:MAG TPA: hypothetical protein VKW08_28325 [Xanthobacteraceae bacterium]|nr:hypothetical protein [Xanthobacteraceae bacterium]